MNQPGESTTPTRLFPAQKTGDVAAATSWEGSPPIHRQPADVCCPGVKVPLLSDQSHSPSQGGVYLGVSWLLLRGCILGLLWPLSGGVLRFTLFWCGSSPVGCT